MLLFRDDPYLQRCSATVIGIEEAGIRLDRTVFYATGGGQPGDSGVLRGADGEVRVVEACKGTRPDDVLHRIDGPAPAPGSAVEAVIDWPRRHRHMRMHTALHLLCAVVPGDVTGGQIGAEKSRLDFNIP